MPVNVFGRHADLADLAYRLVGALDGATVETATRAARVRGRLPSAPADEVTVEVTSEHLGGAAGDRQRAGLTGWLARPTLAGPGREAALSLVDELVVSVAFVIDESAGQDVVDAVVDLAVRVAGWADGFVLAMASDVVLGPDGEIWLEPAAVDRSGPDAPPAEVAPGTASPDPFVQEARRALEVAGPSGQGIVLDAELAEAVPAADPPGTERIGRRLVVTAACAARSLNEVEGQHLVEARAALLDWVEGTGAAEELEPWEAALLAAGPGAIEERDLIDGTWRTEVAVVLAWALGLAALPAPDAVVDPAVLFAAIGLASVDATAAALDGASARPAGQVEVLRRQLLTIHWRLVEHGLRPAPMDLAAVVTEHTWGPLTVEGLPLVDGDLALGGRSITTADPELVRRSVSIAIERHRAVNWLVEGGSFAHTDVST